MSVVVVVVVVGSRSFVNQVDRGWFFVIVCGFLYPSVPPREGDPLQHNNVCVYDE